VRVAKDALAIALAVAAARQLDLVPAAALEEALGAGAAPAERAALEAGLALAVPA